MPVYEFVCPTCREHFDELRPVREADDTAWCPACATEAIRQISRFAFKKSVKAETRESTLQRSSPISHSSGCTCCVPAPPRTRRV